MANCGGIRIIRGPEAREGYLYSHGGGCFLPFLAKDALLEVHEKYAKFDNGAAMPWEFYEMFQRRNWAKATLDEVGGLQHPRVHVDFGKGEVSFVDEYSGKLVGNSCWPFEQFVDLSDAEIDRAYHEGDGLTSEGWAELTRRRGYQARRPDAPPVLLKRKTASKKPRLQLVKP